jgi:thiol-disulfide isomerase/thioredoxin
MKLVSTLAPLFAALLLTATSALAREARPFDAAAFQAAQAEGKTVLVDFAASWCPTCKKQGPAIARVLQEPKFKDVVAFKADFDRETELKKQLKVTGQSTLVVFKGRTEAGRARGITDPAAIGDLLAKGL